MTDGDLRAAESWFLKHGLPYFVPSERAAVRSTWRGTTGGTEIVAHMGGFLTVHGDRIAAHDTYDCYEPFSL